jgi:hypothetical protein
MRDDTLAAFRELVIAAEESGWDVDERAEVLNDARAALVAATDASAWAAAKAWVASDLPAPVTP